MSPDLQTPQVPVRTLPEDRMNPAVAVGADALSGNGNGHIPARPVAKPKRPDRSRSGRRLAQLGLALLAGLLVSTAMFFAEPLQHRCAANLQVPAESEPGRLNDYQMELLGFLWGKPGTKLAQNNFQVLKPHPTTLQVIFDTANLNVGLVELQSHVQEFIASQEAQCQSRLAIPTESESFLQSYVAVLTGRLDDARKRLDEAMASLPAGDPNGDHAALMNRWRVARTSFESARKQLVEAGSQHRNLAEQEQINHAAVNAHDRQAALMADADLQQDLKELETTLTELKLHMLGVWQNSASPLTELTATAAQSLGRSDERESAGASESVRGAYAKLDAELIAYRQSAEAFAKSWNTEFAELQMSPLDPQSSLLLDTHQRIRSLLNDFLFQGGNRLAAIREIVQELSRDPADDARHLLRQSTAARVLAELQAAHHRFEFASGVLDSPAHFRLDSALRIARGLRRRATDRLRVIDERLEQQAIATARQEHTRAITALEAILRESRQASDATVDELIAVQDQLAASKASSQEFLAAVAAAESANQRLQASKVDLEQAKKDLHDLQQKRADADRTLLVKLSWVGVLQQNVNLPERLRDAAVAGSVTFLSVLLGQILLAGALWPR